MDWNTLKGYDEKFAKISTRKHNTFGGKVVEVLYGAQDENGNPVYPKEGANDGHGRWYGIETEGNYQMFSWQHPQCDGGALEFGTENGESALEDMENQLRRKQAICREVEELMRNGADNEAVEALKAEFDGMKNWNTPKDEEYLDRLNRQLSLYERRKADQLQNKAEKEEIVTAAEALVDTTTWKSTMEEFGNLQGKWREIGSAGKAIDDELWSRFSQARRAFTQKRKEYFANLDARNAENRGKKEELIAQAKKIAEDVRNWRDSTDKMVGLMDAWKAIKTAGRDADEELWKEFNTVRSDFFARRREFYNERDAARKTSVDKKKEIIAKAKEIVESGNFDKDNTDTMKELDKVWREAGYSGKDDNNKLWEEFTKLKDSFWGAKRDANQARFKEIIDRKAATIEQMKQQIDELHDRIFDSDDMNRVKGFERRIEEKKNIIANLEKDIVDLKKRLD